MDHFDHQFRDAMSSTVKLLKVDEHEKALELLDGAIEKAIQEGRTNWIRTLCHHAAVVSNFAGNAPLEKHYYEQSLAYNPENSRALYGLAKVALEQGETEIAKQYAIRCHSALMQSEDGVIKQGLLELLATHWPGVVAS